MRKPLALLVASTALSAAVGFPGWGGSAGPSGPGAQAPSAASGDAPETLPLILAGSHDRDHHARDRHHSRDRHGDDDDDDDDDDDGDDDGDDDDDDDCDDDEGDCGVRMRTPAPAGTVAPPANGLFLDGTPPKVKVN